MLRIERVLGSRVEAHLAAALHELEHRGAVDVLPVAAADISRRSSAFRDLLNQPSIFFFPFGVPAHTGGE